MRFAIFTHVLHHTQNGGYSAYAPYIREMNLWLKYVEEVEIIAPAPLSSIAEFSALESYHHFHLTVSKVPSFNLLNSRSSIKAFFLLPFILYRIISTMRRADHLHLRCPGNLGLLACICQIFFPSKPKTAKYAGNWDPKAAQPWTYKLQKWILSNTFLTNNMQVLVYGHWPMQSKNILSFFTASFSEKEISGFNEKNFHMGLTFLFVGNLVPGKHPLKAIQLVQEINSQKNLTGEKQEVSLEIYGDGVERKILEAYCRNEKLEGLVKFRGSSTLEELKMAYKNAHFVILPSQSEGWPKAIAEGMFFGCIPIATAISCIPWMLNFGSRGILIPDIEKRKENKEKRRFREVESEERKVESREVLEETVNKIMELLKDPEEMRRMSMQAQEWSQQYTLEKFESEIKKLLVLQTS